MWTLSTKMSVNSPISSYSVHLVIVQTGRSEWRRRTRLGSAYHEHSSRRQSVRILLGNTYLHPKSTKTLYLAGCDSDIPSREHV